MPKFGQKSLARLKTCDKRLRDICNELIKETDFTVLCGFRNEAEQTDAYNSGNSKAKWKQSPHNYSPSLAIDIAPYPIDWNDTARFDELAIRFKRVADELAIDIEWGGDFKSIVDKPHWEIKNWKDDVRD